MRAVTLAHFVFDPTLLFLVFAAGILVGFGAAARVAMKGRRSDDR